MHLASLREHGVEHMGSGVLFGVQCRSRGGAGEAGGGAVAAAAAGGGAAGGGGGAAGGVAAGGGAEARGVGGSPSGISYPMEGAGGETENLVARAGGDIRKVCEQMLRVEAA